MFRYVMKFIHPNGLSHIEENINFPTKTKAKTYINYYNTKIMNDMRFDIVYMEVNEQTVTKSKIYNEIVNDFEKNIFKE